MRAGLYARVSTIEQAEEGYSIEAQLEAMRRYCHEQGWSVIAEYKDEGISGATDNRPALLEAFADCEARNIDALLTHQLDRFYRNLRLQLDAMERLERWGIVYASVAENLDFSTPHGRLVASMMGSINQYYIENLSRETRKGKRGRVRAGYSNASHPPHGYKRVDGKDVIDPQTAKAIVLAFETYAGGLHSDQDIADLLKERGFKPHKHVRSGRWTRGNVQHMLRNRFYIGEVRYHKQWLPGKHKPIISRELFDQVQAVRNGRGHKGTGGGGGKGRGYLLSKIAVCSQCGRLMHTARIYGSKQVHDYYRDSAAIAGVDCPVAGRHIPMGVIDKQVGELVKRLTLPDDWRERLQELAGQQGGQKGLESKRRYLKDKLKRLRDLYIDGDYTKVEYNERKAKLEAKLGALYIPQLSELKVAGETLETLGEVWDDTPLQLKSKMLRTIFQEVVIDAAGRRLVSVKPWPQFAPLFKMDGLREKDGYFYVEEGQETGPKD